MKTFAIAALALTGASASAASFEVRGSGATVQMHKSFLKVYSQDDLTPAFSGIADHKSFDHGAPQMHTIILDNIADTCAGSWGERPCVPFRAHDNYPAMFYCGWADASGDTTWPEQVTGPYKPSLAFFKEGDTILGKEARLSCKGPASTRNAHHDLQLKVYFGDGADRIALKHVGPKGSDMARVRETAAPTQAPTSAPTAAPTPAPTPLFGLHTPSGYTCDPRKTICYKRMPAAVHDAAINACKQEGARVCEHNDMQELCGSGIDSYAGAPLGWYGDHGRASGGDWDDEFGVWNQPGCAKSSNDGPSRQGDSENIPFNCCKGGDLFGGSSGCPSGLDSVTTPNGEICAGPMEGKMNTDAAIKKCWEKKATMCTHNDFMQLAGSPCTSTEPGICWTAGEGHKPQNPWGNKNDGWYGDHGTASNGNWDDECKLPHPPLAILRSHALTL